MMTCPICKKTVAPGDPEFPFCSERCRIIDLGNWATEKYRVAAETQMDESEPENGATHEPPPDPSHDSE